MRLRQSYHLYAAITVVLWSLSYVFTRLALQCFSPFSLGLLRYFLASCFLAVVLLVRKTGWPKREAVGLLIASGAAGFFLYMLTFNTGSQTVTAATSCTVIATVPLITILLARVVYHEMLTALQYVSACISFGGVVLTVWNLRLSGGAGLLYIFAAAVLLSIYNLLQRRLTRICSPLQTTAFSIFFGTLMLGIFTPNVVRELPAATPRELVVSSFWASSAGLSPTAAGPRPYLWQRTLPASATICLSSPSSPPSSVCSSPEKRWSPPPWWAAASSWLECFCLTVLRCKASGYTGGKAYEGRTVKPTGVPFSEINRQAPVTKNGALPF